MVFGCVPNNIMENNFVLFARTKNHTNLPIYL